MLRKEFYAGFCDDSQTKACIKEQFDKYSYVCDTHTAVAVKVYEDYREKTKDKTKTIIASTASPYKFSNSVLVALSEIDQAMDEFELVDRLNEVSKLDIPKSLAELKYKEIRFNDTIEKNDMKAFVLKSLGI